MDFPGKDTRFLGGVEESVVADFEKRRGLELPAEYRQFLREHGAGIIGSEEVFGLAGKRLHLDNVSANLTARGFVLPNGLLPIAEVGDGSFVVLGCAAVGPLASGRVGYWLPRRDEQVDVQTGPDSFLVWARGSSE